MPDFAWKDVKTVADLGSGIGGMGTKLVQHYPHLDVTLHDLPDVMKDARSVRLLLHSIMLLCLSCSAAALD
jgi:16S rRNA G1207 methylase RsmC